MEPFSVKAIVTSTALGLCTFQGYRTQVLYRSLKPLMLKQINVLAAMGDYSLFLKSFLFKQNDHDYDLTQTLEIRRHYEEINRNEEQFMNFTISVCC